MGQRSCTIDKIAKYSNPHIWLLRHVDGTIVTDRASRHWLLNLFVTPVKRQSILPLTKLEDSSSKRERDGASNTSVIYRLGPVGTNGTRPDDLTPRSLCVSFRDQHLQKKKGRTDRKDWEEKEEKEPGGCWMIKRHQLDGDETKRVCS